MSHEDINKKAAIHMRFLRIKLLIPDFHHSKGHPLLSILTSFMFGFLNLPKFYSTENEKKIMKTLLFIGYYKNTDLYPIHLIGTM